MKRLYCNRVLRRPTSHTLLPVLGLLGLLTTAFAQAEQWRPLAADNAVLMTLPQGKVVIELAPQMAPKHVAQFKKLLKQGFYDGKKFYRVIDGFVAQAGPAEDASDAPTLAMESEWHPAKDWHWQAVETQDMFAPSTGFYRGFALGYQQQDNTAWLTHCPGVLAMARSNEPDSGSSHFYFTIGQAPRYLDRIMTIFGRVVYGMEHIQAIKRTQVLEGQDAVPEQEFTPISAMQLMSDVPKAQQIALEIEDTESSEFGKALKGRRERNNAFFYKKPPPVLDVCQIPVKTRLVKQK